jgi:pimeloyl-ACP methyl ester carboxylesterase
MTRHTALFYQRSNRTLVVTFDNMKSRETPSPAYPWGYDFLAKQDYSHLGIVMRRRNDWFRHKDLANFFDMLRDDGFFDTFDNVVFYGSSMGGYGALAYASASPGARVVTFSPQTSLDPAHVPFESRYRNGFARGDWSGPYLDGAFEARTASQVIVFYDPYEGIDRSHVLRLEANTRLNRMKMPFAGHDTMRRLVMQEILPEICFLALEGKLTAKCFNNKLRASRGVQAVARKSLNRAIEKGHPQLVMKTLSQLEKTKPKWNFPKIKRAAQEAINRSAPHS